MLIPALLLLCLGITVIYTSNHTLALQQAIFGLVGIALFLGISRLDYRVFKDFSKGFYVLCLALLVIVFLIGSETRGSVRWIPLGFFNLQPSELAKLSLVISLSVFWVKNVPSWKNIFLSFLIFSLPGALVFKQPDLGTALTLGFIWLGLLVGANASFFKIGLLGLVGAIFAPFGWNMLHDYQRTRFLSFLAPATDPLGVGYNVIQSTIAVGSGEILGRGLGRGTQSRLQFLPEFRTDFIFAFIAEELGFVGSVIVLSLYSIFFYLLFNTLFRVDDRFGELMIIGIGAMFCFQIVVNIGMNIGIMPITGITLPFLSYGGSSVITSMIALGFVESVRKHGLKQPQVEVFGV